MIKDESNVKNLLDVLDKLNRGYVEIGILGDNSSQILLIAEVQEYGINIKVTDKMRKYLAAQGMPLKSTTKEIHIPERSYIRGSYDENKKKIYQLESMIDEVITFKITPDELLERMGAFCVGIIQEYLIDLKKPANHPFTTQQKGSSNPLIDSGQLLNSINYKVKYK